MITLKLFSFLTIFMALSSFAFAQKAAKETIPVSGNCGMCKNKIEKAAKGAGAADAIWDADKKMLTIKYNNSTTNAAKIQGAVAAAGYDTRDVKSTDDAYNKLHGCCKYDRAALVNEEQKMSAHPHMTEGKGMGQPDVDCCKDGNCSKPGHDGKECCKSSATSADCCKDGKCSKPGHDGKNCCKASH